MAWEKGQVGRWEKEKEYILRMAQEQKPGENWDTSQAEEVWGALVGEWTKVDCVSSDCL